MARRSRSFNSNGRLDGNLRRAIVVSRFRMKLAAAQHVDGRVDGCALEVGGRQGIVSPPGQDAQEDGLQDVFCVGRIPRDAQGRAEDRLVVALVQPGKPRQRGRGSQVGDRQFVDLRCWLWAPRPPHQP